MSEEVIGKALIELADLANAVAGDFHCLHLNIVGQEFDSMHKDVLKKYYEEAADDYDELAEKARMYGVIFPSPNKSAERIGFESYEPTEAVSRVIAIDRVKILIEELQELYLKLFNVMNKMCDCARSVGVANFLQTRLEFWSKECYYFNQSRSMT